MPLTGQAQSKSVLANVLSQHALSSSSMQREWSQTTSLRRRRAKAIRPPQAITSPGKPAPAIGPGTWTSTGPVLPV